MTGARDAPSRAALARLFAIIYVSMLLFGIVETVKSVVLPAIKLEFGTSYIDTGTLVSFGWLGYVLLCFVVTLIIARVGIKKSILAGYVLILGGSLLVLFTMAYYQVMLSLFLVSASFGFFEVGNNALAMQIFKRRTALLMSLMHFFYGLGAVIGPPVAAGILATPAMQALGQGAWRMVYGVLAVPVIAITVLVALTRFKLQGPPAGPDAGHGAPVGDIDRIDGRHTFLSVLKMPVTWIFIASLGLMEVVEFGAANWSPFYLREAFGFPPETGGAVFVSSFYVAFTVSRLLGGPLIERAGYHRSLVGSLVATIALYVLGFSLGAAGIWFLVLTGVFVAQFWILLLSIAERRFGIDAAMVTSVIITMSGLVNGVFQVVIGITSELAGPAWGYGSCLFYAIVVLALVIAGKRWMLLPGPVQVPVPALPADGPRQRDRDAASP